MKRLKNIALPSLLLAALLLPGVARADNSISLRIASSYFTAQGYDAVSKNNSLVQAEFNYARSLLKLWRGYLWADQEQPGLAIDDLERAADMGYDSREVRDKLGLLSYQQEDWPGCVAQLSRSIDKDPENAWAYEMRARCRFSQGDATLAREDAKAACDMGHDEGCRMLRSMR